MAIDIQQREDLLLFTQTIGWMAEGSALPVYDPSAQSDGKCIVCRLVGTEVDLIPFPVGIMGGKEAVAYFFTVHPRCLSDEVGGLHKTRLIEALLLAEKLVLKYAATPTGHA